MRDTDSELERGAFWGKNCFEGVRGASARASCISHGRGVDRSWEISEGEKREGENAPIGPFSPAVLRHKGLLLALACFLVVATCPFWFNFGPLEPVYIDEGAFVWQCARLHPRGTDAGAGETGAAVSCQNQTDALTFVGLAATAASTALSCFAGLSYSKFGAKKTSITGFILQLVGIVWLAAGVKSALLIIPLTLIGAGASFSFFGFVFLSQFFGDRQALVLGLLGAVRSVGFLIPAVIGWLYTDYRIPARSLYLSLAGFILVMALLYAHLIPHKHLELWHHRQRCQERGNRYGGNRYGGGDKIDTSDPKFEVYERKSLECFAKSRSFLAIAGFFAILSILAAWFAVTAGLQTPAIGRFGKWLRFTSCFGSPLIALALHRLGPHLVLYLLAFVSLFLAFARLVSPFFGHDNDRLTNHDLPLPNFLPPFPGEDAPTFRTNTHDDHAFSSALLPIFFFVTICSFTDTQWLALLSRHFPSWAVGELSAAITLVTGFFEALLIPGYDITIESESFLTVNLLLFILAIVALFLAHAAYTFKHDNFHCCPPLRDDQNGAARNCAPSCLPLCPPPCPPLPLPPPDSCCKRSSPPLFCQEKGISKQGKGPHSKARPQTVCCEEPDCDCVGTHTHTHTRSSLLSRLTHPHLPHPHLPHPHLPHPHFSPGDCRATRDVPLDESFVSECVTPDDRYHRRQPELDCDPAIDFEPGRGPEPEPEFEPDFEPLADNYRRVSDPGVARSCMRVRNGPREKCERPRERCERPRDRCEDFAGHSAPHQHARHLHKLLHRIESEIEEKVQQIESAHEILGCPSREREAVVRRVGRRKAAPEARNLCATGDPSQRGSPYLVHGDIGCREKLTLSRIGTPVPGETPVSRITGLKSRETSRNGGRRDREYDEDVWAGTALSVLRASESFKDLNDLSSRVLEADICTKKNRP